MNSKTIFIDIDGTLLSHRTGIPKSAMEAIDLARKNGHKVFINTGRVSSAVDDYLKFFPFDGYVFAAGGHVVVKDESIFTHLIDPTIVRQAIGIFEKHRVGYVLEGSDASYYNTYAIDFFRRKYEENNLKDKPQLHRHLVQENMVSPISQYSDENSAITKFSIFTNTHQQLLDCQNEFPSGFQFILYETSGEIVTSGINKATGIQKVLDYLGAEQKDTFAIGDSMNDYEMVQFANTGIAMGNAVETLKNVADYVTFNVDDHGLFHAFKVFGLID